MRVNEKVFKFLEGQKDEIKQDVDSRFDKYSDDELDVLYERSIKNFETGTLLQGVVVDCLPDDVIVDVGYKSEGIVSLNQFGPDEAPEIGDTVEVLLEAVEDDSGTIVISKQKAARMRGWERVIEKHAVGDVVTGAVIRKIKGGLLVDIGVPVFLPASQVDIRRVSDIGDYVHKEIECKIITIDEARRNIVVSRRSLLEEDADRKKGELLENIEVGNDCEGVVKNITDFGVFIDLGGLDGLLHITDMSWSRISHPSEIISIDDKVTIRILKVDRETERVSLGLKQLTPNPWDSIEERYPVGSKVNGLVVNVMNYGCFVKLEDGVEGLVHISEMSWTRRVAHPSELVSVGQEIEVVILDVRKEKQEISLGMKQIEEDPWSQIEVKYPVGSEVNGIVRNLTSYGAFIEIEEGIDGLLHVSDMSWTKKVDHPSRLLTKGEEIKAIILSIDPGKRRLALGLKQTEDDPWETWIVEKYHTGDVLQGKITKIAKFGAFVEIDKDLEGLLHVSELSTYQGKRIEDVLGVDDKVEVQILRVDRDERKIGLTLIRILERIERPEEESADVEEASGESETSATEETEVIAVKEEESSEEPVVVEEAPSAEPVEEASNEPETSAIEETEVMVVKEDASEEVSEDNDEQPVETAPVEEIGEEIAKDDASDVSESEDVQQSQDSEETEEKPAS